MVITARSTLTKWRQDSWKKTQMELPEMKTAMCETVNMLDYQITQCGGKKLVNKNAKQQKAFETEQTHRGKN